MLQSTKKRDCNIFFAMFSLKVLNVAIVAINSLLNSFFSKKTTQKVTKRLLRTSKKALFQTFTRILMLQCYTDFIFSLYIAKNTCNINFLFVVTLVFSCSLYNLTNAPSSLWVFSLWKEICVWKIKTKLSKKLQKVLQKVIWCDII